MSFSEDDIRRTKLPPDVFGILHDLAWSHVEQSEWKLENMIQRAQEALRLDDRLQKSPCAPKMRSRKPMKKFSGKGSRVGKLGIVRLTGDDLADLRVQCFIRDGWKCQGCGCEVSMNGLFRFKRAEMAHIRTKRNHGDTLSNVRTLCPDCHRLEHNGGKPCPPKVQP